MKDIFEILKDNGIEVPEEKHKELRRSLNENYIAINEHTKKLEKVNEQINSANDTITDLKGKIADAAKVDVKALQDKIKEFEDAEEYMMFQKSVECKIKTGTILNDKMFPICRICENINNLFDEKRTFCKKH